MAKALWRRPVVVVPAAVVVIGGAAFFGLRAGKSNAGAAQRGTNQQLYTVQPTTLQQTVSASGTIASSDTEDMSFSSSGTVTAVNVKAGQQVSKGQVLASIDSAALQSDLQQAEASLASAQAQLTDDENNSASSAQVSADQANVAAAQANAVSAYEALLGANLTSPIAGTVSTVNLAVGQVLGSSGSSGTGLTGTGTGSGRSPSTGSSGNGTGGNGANASNASNASSSNSSSAQIEVVSNSFVVNLSVDTRTLSSIKVGQTATVTPTSSSGTSRGSGGGALAFFGGGGFAGGGGANNASSQSNASTAIGAAATGKVTSVGTVASSSSGVATFPVVITMDGTPASFHAGASASAAIVTGELANVLAVPLTAVTQSNGQSSVTLSVNGRQSKEAVTTGTTVNGLVQITGGLQAGDQVVVTVPTFRRTTGNGGGNGNGGNGVFPGGGGGFRGGGGGFFGPGGGAGG